MTTYKMTTTLEVSERPPIIFNTELTTAGEPPPNETLHSMLKGHIAILRNELETLERAIKWKPTTERD